MRCSLPRLLAIALLLSPFATGPTSAKATAGGQDGATPLINSMDDVKVVNPKEKGRAETVEGKVGKAVKFTFENACKSAFCITNIRGTADWDQAAGFSF